MAGAPRRPSSAAAVAARVPRNPNPAAATLYLGQAAADIGRPVRARARRLLEFGASAAELVWAAGHGPWTGLRM